MKWFSSAMRICLLMTGLGSALYCRVAKAQDKHLPKYQSQLSAMLQRASANVPEGQDGDRARMYLASALSLNGDYEAAKFQIKGFKLPYSRSRLWSKLGYIQRKYKRDDVAAKNSFDIAVQEARRMEGGSSDQQMQLAEVARLQARSEDISGALETVGTISPLSQFDALADVARIAAHQGDFRPAQQLLVKANDDEEKSLANSLVCIGHAEAYNWEAALEALRGTTWPLHRVPALLALSENQKLERGEINKFLREALEFVPQIRSDGVIDTSDVARDADYGAIALAQLRNKEHTSKEAAIAKSLEALRLVKEGDNAQEWSLKIATILADEDLPQAREVIALCGNDVLAIGAVVKILGEEWAWKYRTEEDKAVLTSQMSELINQALDQVRNLEGSSKEWSLAEVAKMTAQAHDFNTAQKLAEQIETPRRKAYALAGIARAAIQQDNAERVSWSLNLMEAAAQKAEPQERSEITGQCIESILEQLMEYETVSFSAAVAGLK